MAYNQMFGRGNSPKTGNGLPEGLNSGSTASTSIDPKLQQKAKAIADAKLAQNIQNKPLGNSSDVRTESGTATNIKQAKTPAEIKAWQNAVKSGKASGKYNETVTMTSTASGQDQTPIKTEETTTPPLENKQKPKYYGTWFSEKVNQPFGGYGEWGISYSKEDMQARQAKNDLDIRLGSDLSNRGRTTSAQNTFRNADVTEIEDKVSSRYGDIAGPFDSAWKDSAGKGDHSPGSGEKRRQEWLTSAYTKITGQEAERKKLMDAAAARREALKAEAIAKQKSKAEALAAKKAEVLAAKKAAAQK